MSVRTETFGSFARRTRPDVFSQHDVDKIDQHIASGLADDTKRGAIIKSVREQFGIKPDVPDTIMYDWLVNSVQHKFKVAPQAIRDRPPQYNIPSPLSEAAEQRYATDLETAGKLQDTRLERQGVNAEQFPTENTQAQRERAMRNVPPLEAVAQDEGPSATPIGVRAPKKTYPLVNDWRDFMRIAREKEPGLNSPDGKRYAIRMLDQFPALVDKDNADEVVVMLDTGPAENASFPQDMVPGMNILSRFGPGSDVQQGIAAAARKVYDPASRSSRGAPEGAVRTGYGLAEYGQDTGEDIAKRVPGAAKAAGSAAAWFGRGVAGLGTVASQAKVARLNALAEELKQRQAAGVPPGRDMGMFLAGKEDLELADIVEQMREKADATQPLPRIQAQIYREAQQEIARRLQEEAGGQSERQTFAQYLKGTTPEQAEAIGQDVLPQAGRMAANVANVVANIPSEVTLGAKAGMAALRSAPVDKALSSVGEAWAGTPVAKWFSNQPSALGVSSQKVSQVADTPNVAVRSFANEILHGPEAQKLATEHDLRTKFDAVFAKHGVPDEKKAELLSALGPTAENPELGRMLKGAAQSAPVGSTPAVMEDLLEVFRPEKSKLTWQTAVKEGLIRDRKAEALVAEDALAEAVSKAKAKPGVGQEATTEALLAQEWANRVRTGETPVSMGAVSKAAAEKAKPVFARYESEADYVAAASARAEKAANEVIAELAEKSRGAVKGFGDAAHEAVKDVRSTASGAVEKFIGKEGAGAPAAGTLQASLITKAMQRNRVPKDYQEWVGYKIRQYLDDEARGFGKQDQFEGMYVRPSGGRYVDPAYAESLKESPMRAYREGRLAHLLTGEQAGKVERAIGKADTRATKALYGKEDVAAGAVNLAERRALPLAARMKEAQTRTGERLLRVYQRMMLREADKMLDAAGITDKYARRTAKQEMLFRLVRGPAAQDAAAEAAARGIVGRPAATQADTALALEKAPIKGENPYHVIYGQNPLRAGGTAESKLARDVEETGGAFEDAYTKDIGKPASIADVAGASGLGAEAKRMVPMVPKSRADYIEAKRNLELSRGLTPKQADRASAKLFDKPITSQLAETHNKLLEMAGVFRRRASEGLAQQLFRHEQAKKGQYFANLSELERHLGTADDQASKLRTTYGQERAAEAAKVDVERYLADNGLVVIRTGDQPITSGGKMVGKFLEDATGSPRVIKLPGGTEALHGKIVPRAVAKAVLEASEPQKNKILDWARAANKVLGANQLKAMMTIARPGFEQRNTFSDFIKAGMDEGFNKVYSSDNMGLWARISNAGPDEVFKVGNQTVTRRSLFTELGLGRGFSDATRREAIPEAGDTLAQALRGIDVDPAKWPRAYRWATRMTDARDAAASALAKPTLAYEKGVSRKAMWSGTDINPEYSSSDNIRMLHALSKIRRGESLRQAGVETTALMLDYANKSLAAQVAENFHFIPFATYYGGAARSLATLAARNPRAYKHINDARLAIEGVDRALDQRGEYDPRTKPIAAQVGLMPAVTIGDQYTVADIENPAREAGQFTGRFAESGDESQTTNLARALAGYVGPGWQAAYEGATGLNMGTGRPVLPVPLSSREYAELFGGAPHSKLGEIQAASDYAQREFGTAPWFGAPMVVGGRDIKPEVTLAYQLGKRALPGHVSSLLANALDIGYSPMREMPEAARSKLGRDVARWITGAGSYPVASVRQKVYKERQNAQATPLGDAIHRAVRAGKLQEAGK